MDRFHRPILAELARRGTPFRGALYAGLMLTADGPVLLECNARFGDPETQAILPRIAAPLGPLLLAAARGRLLEALGPLGLEGSRLPVLPDRDGGDRARGGRVSGGPDPTTRSTAWTGRAGHGALVFHAGTARQTTVPTARPVAASSPSSVEARTSRTLARRPKRPPPRSRSMGRSDVTTSASIRSHRRSRSMIRRYTLAEMGAIWTEERAVRGDAPGGTRRRRAQAARGIVPAAALAALETRRRVDIERINEIERTTDHDVIAFVSQVAETVGPEGRYLHLGLTSSDVVDTGTRAPAPRGRRAPARRRDRLSGCSLRALVLKPTRR